MDNEVLRMVLTFVSAIFGIAVLGTVPIVIAVLVYRFRRKSDAAIKELQSMAEYFGVDGYSATYPADRRKLRNAILEAIERGRNSTE